MYSIIKENKYIISFWVFAVVVSIFFLQIPDSCVFGGVDGSFRYAFNSFFAYHKYLFSNIKYPCGPLLFLKYPISYGSHIVLANIFELSIRFILCMYVLQFAKLFVPNKKYIIAVALSLFFAYFLYLDYLIVAVVIFASIAYLKNDKLLNFVMALVVFALALFIKSGISIPVAVVWFMLCVLLLATQKFISCIKINLILLLVCTILSLLIYSSPFAFFKHIYTDAIMSITYGSEAVLFVKNNWTLLAFSIVSILCIPFIKEEKELQKAFSLVCLYVFIMWKYSISRQDESHNFNWLYMIIIVAPLFIITAKRKIVVALCCISSFIFFALNTKQLFGKVAIGRVNPTFEHFNLLFLNTTKNKQERLAVSKAETQKFVLKAELLNILGKQTVDIYPYELSIAFANNLNYLPRTCLQINSFGVRGDILDSVFYASKQSPEFILWHSSDTKNIFMDGLDGKHLQHENASSLLAIWQYYNLVYTDTANYFLFKKTASHLPYSNLLHGVVQAKFNEPISLPINLVDTADNNIILLKCNWQNFTILKMQKFFYKGLQYTLEYKLFDDTIIKYNISEQALHKGIIINKLFLKPNGKHSRIKEFKIICNNKNLHSNNLELKFLRRSVVIDD